MGWTCRGFTEVNIIWGKKWTYVCSHYSLLLRHIVTFPRLRSDVQTQVLKHVGPETIITHEVSAQTAGNLIGQRDFLSVRHSCKHKSSLYLGGAAIQLESFPPQAGFVR